MIDWFNLVANALWVLGCATALAVLSYTSWQASLHQEKMVARLRRPAAQAALSLAGLLFFLGLGVLSDALLPRVVYLLLALVLFVLMISALWALRRSAPPALRSDEEG